MGKATNRTLIQKYFNTYFSRYAHRDEYLRDQTVEKDLGIAVTIPCYNEPDLINTLESLHLCQQTLCPVEIIVLINHPEGSDLKIIEHNRSTYNIALDWADKFSTNQKKFHIMPVLEIPGKKAGVGMARKIVMDEALRRFARTGALEGIITGLDADTICDPNYLKGIEQYFTENPGVNGATIYFEHPIEPAHDPEHALGIASYELHLRYLIHALRYAGFPYAFHALGSSIAVRASVYAKQGGMNTRQAGEDFYFLQKILPLKNFGEIHTTKVMPSGRISDRVPFGTGKAMKEWKKSGVKVLNTYNPNIFEDLKHLYWHIEMKAMLRNSEIRNFYLKLPESIKGFIPETEWIGKLDKIRRNTTNPDTFKYQFFQWMNGLRTLKFIHYARDHLYKNVPVAEAYDWLSQRIGLPAEGSSDIFHALQAIRDYDRSNPFFFDGRGIH